MLSEESSTTLAIPDLIQNSHPRGSEEDIRLRHPDKEDMYRLNRHSAPPFCALTEDRSSVYCAVSTCACAQETLTVSDMEGHLRRSQAQANINKIFYDGSGLPPKPPVRKKRKSRSQRSEDGAGNSSINSSPVATPTSKSPQVTLRRSQSRTAQDRKGSDGSDIVAWKQTLQWVASEDDLDPGVVVIPRVSEWFTSQDGEGRLYFFEENSNESSWTLPEVCITPSDTVPASPGTSRSEDSTMSKSLTNDSLPEMDSSSQAALDQGGSANSSKQNTPPRSLVIGGGARFMKTRSMVVLDSRGDVSLGDKDVLGSGKSSSIPRNQIYLQKETGKLLILKEGQMNRTKITENGKKTRKNWSSSFVILTDQHLLLFKDHKAFVAWHHASSHAKPELVIELNGAVVEWTQDKSSRKNVFQVNSHTDLQMLFQVDESDSAHEWFQTIGSVIGRLPNGRYVRRRPGSESPQLMELSTPEEGRKFTRLGRSKSTKVKTLGSVEDLTISSENKTKIRARLKKFFYKRPPVETLVKKGIWKDEPVFGCYLHKLCTAERTTIPRFVQECIAVIEGKAENMKADGLYRASGNLSQVQKIRLQVDQDNMSVLELEEDVHVLTGSLKLFFRELREPLIPYHLFEKALKASSNQNLKEKVQKFREIVTALSKPNHDTLKFLLRHLLKVTEYKEWNRMHIPNLAIVFGPTLMWPEHESANLALDMMQQNLVIECLLQEFETIFR